ncbi:hypothetical protein RSEGYP2_21 [Ralstonia phage RsoP1EGY]|uniref:Uncharacterized protein n=1 Tax=Ralstonia phage RsoP1EGY TaxID=2070026 RepID=A0A2R2ZGF8_9CAUD|nr:endonuclease [Ralstonia phage RsoP1EGY]AUO78181.1 hypothetical protein RSEGYP2_21 [Ralstonia phage RsoP1EGY]
MSGCKKCGVALVPGENWYPSLAKKNNQVCKRCHTARSEAKRIEDRETNLPKWMLRNARNRAKAQGLPFDLEESDIQIPLLCPVLGIPLEVSRGHFTDNSLALDKFIPELGYVKGNVAVISQKANVMKSNATIQEVEALAAWMRSRA